MVHLSLAWSLVVAGAHMARAVLGSRAVCDAVPCGRAGRQVAAGETKREDPRHHD